MKYFEDHQNLLKYVKVCAIFFSIWPLNPKTGNFKRALYKGLWWFYIMFTITTLPTFVYGAYLSYGDLVNFMKSLTETVYLMEATFNFFWAKTHEQQLRILMSEIEELEGTATREEKLLRRKFVKRTSTAYPAMMFIFVFGALFFVFSPIVVPKRITPLNAVYPFPVERDSWARFLVYACNILAILMASNAIVVDLLVIMLIWFGSFKFALLADSFRTVVNCEQLRHCVIKHQEALRYAKGIENSARSIVVKSTSAVSMYMIACSLLVLNNVPVFELTQFILITLLSSLRLYMVSWSANVMTDIAHSLAWSIYDSPWIDSCVEIRKNMIIIICRSQIPVVISVAGVISSLSLKFCAFVLYKVFSYFMTLRAILRV